MIVFGVYVSASERGQENLRVGLEQGVWGIRAASVFEKLHIPGDPRTGEDILRSMKVGDGLLIGTRGPNPRVPAGGWAGETLGAAYLLRIAAPYYLSMLPVWTDDIYEHRVDFERVSEAAPALPTVLGARALEALRVSANSRGLPVPIDMSIPLLEGEVPEDGVDLDILTVAVARREQARLRASLLGNAPSGQCALCGRTVDRDQVRAAHIKPRAMCSTEERLDLGNVMLNCLLGCDSLFEHGYVSVDHEGKVVPTERRPATPDVQTAVDALAGRPCLAFRAASEPYFAWHAERSQEAVR